MPPTRGVPPMVGDRVVGRNKVVVGEKVMDAAVGVAAMVGTSVPAEVGSGVSPGGFDATGVDAEVDSKVGVSVSTGVAGTGAGVGSTSVTKTTAVSQSSSSSHVS